MKSTSRATDQKHAAENNDNVTNKEETTLQNKTKHEKDSEKLERAARNRPLRN